MATQDQLVAQIRDGCLVVSKKLGPGLNKEIYVNALALEMEKSGLIVALSPTFDIYYGEIKVGDAQPDLIVEGSMVVQVKAGLAFNEAEQAVAIHNLKAADVEYGLLVNFASPGVEFRQIKHSPMRKPTRG
jgi:GxxExxY protein